MIAKLAAAMLAIVHDAEPFEPGENCEIPPEVRRDFLNQNGLEFDQSPLGWRSLGKSKCYAAAETLIADYILFSPNREDVVERLRILRFHAGQMSAYAGDRTRAIDYFRGSLVTDNDAANAWNHYVMGSIAFLKKDRSALQTHWKAAGDAATADFGRGNQAVLEGFIACFDKTYAEAYGNDDCQAAYTEHNTGD